MSQLSFWAEPVGSRVPRDRVRARARGTRAPTVWFLQLLFCTVFSLAAIATEVTSDMAARAARNWRVTKDVLACSLGRTVASARTVTTARAKFNVVTFSEGGFVVTAADTAIRPIIFFADGADVDEDPENPLYELLQKDVEICAEAATNTVALASVRPGAATGTSSAAEQAWASLLADPDPKAVELATVSVSDIRRGPLLETAWSQKYAGDVWCYNYYTPNHDYCGCVATAMAQVMKYFAHPTASVTARTNPNCSVSGTTTSLTMKGGVYDWANMPNKPTSSYDWSIRAKVGQICYDAGVAIGMRYASGGSSSAVPPAAWALRNVFGYSQAIAAVRTTSSLKTSSSAHTRQVMLTNFDAWLPVIAGMEGHAIVVDGYGYSNGSLCYHLNYGWGGTSNGWYCPPDLGNDNSVFGSLIYNIYPSQKSTLVIVSGRVLSTAGATLEGATVKAMQGTTVAASATSDSKGVFCLYVPASSTYTILAEYGRDSATATATTAAIKSVGTVLSGSMPNRSYYTGNCNADCCNAYVGDMQLYTTRPIATVDGTPYYNTFAEACAAAQAGQTVVLKESVAETSVTVPNACTIDLGGNIFKGTLFAQNDAGTLTIRNGTVTGGSDSLDGASGAGSYPNGTIVFEDVTMTGNVWSDNHRLIFTSGTFTGAVHFGTQGGTINGGRFTNILRDGGVSPLVNDGEFASDFSSVTAVAAGSRWSESSGDADYPWTVVAQPVAQIGTAYYTTLAEAYGAATDGETIKLLKDQTAGFTLETGVTFDLGDCTFGGVLTLAGDATVTNGTLASILVTAGHPTFAGGTVTACEQTGTGQLRVTGGTITALTVTNCTAATILAGGRIERLAAVAGTEIRADAKSSCSVTSLTTDRTRVILDGGTFGTVRLTNTPQTQVIGKSCTIQSLSTTNCTRLLNGKVPSQP